MDIDRLSSLIRGRVFSASLWLIQALRTQRLSRSVGTDRRLTRILCGKSCDKKMCVYSGCPLRCPAYSCYSGGPLLVLTAAVPL